MLDHRRDKPACILYLLYTCMYTLYMLYTVEPPNKGHFRNGSFVLSSEVVPISEVHCILILLSSLQCLKCIKLRLCLVLVSEIVM